VRAGCGSVGGGAHARGGSRLGCERVGPSCVERARASCAAQSHAGRARVGGLVSGLLAQSLVRPLGLVLVHHPRGRYHTQF
jgi:hypothetical protein